MPTLSLPHRTRALATALFAVLVLPAQQPARPATAAAALAAFAAVKDRSEAERRRPAQALGAFADQEVTDVLLRELAAATEPGYRQDLMRALGKHERSGAVPGLCAALQQDRNPRLLETAAQALLRQGSPGVEALVALLDAGSAAPGVERSRRTAVLAALGDSPLPTARARVCAEARTAAGRDRLPALRALAGVAGDPDVDDLRHRLAEDRDVVVAAAALQQLAAHGDAAAPAAALALHRRGVALDAEAHTAVLHGLLCGPTEAAFAPVLAHAAAADDPLASARLPLWQRLCAEPAFATFLATAAPALKPAGERRVAAVLLGLLPATSAPMAQRGLDALLEKAEPEVAFAAVAALQLRGTEQASQRLRTLLERGAAERAAPALLALQAMAPSADERAALLLPLARDARPPVRAAALELLAACAPPPPSKLPSPLPPTLVGALAAGIEGLAHARWPVRAAAVRLLVALRRKDAVPPLIAALDDAEARLRHDVKEALHDLTLQRFPDAAAWNAWWKQQGRDYELPAPAAKPARPAATATVTYWNLPVVSERIVFVIDTSGSTSTPFGSGGITRLQAAQQQLERALGQLPPKARCNVVSFAWSATAFADTLQPADSKRRAAMLAHAATFEARGPTNVHAALRLAFADPEVDTIFLLTDGQPSAGAIVDTAELAAEVRRWNVGRGVAIHTIALGGRSEFLEQLARDSGGEHTVAR